MNSCTYVPQKKTNHNLNSSSTTIFITGMKQKYSEFHNMPLFLPEKHIFLSHHFSLTLYAFLLQVT